MQIIEPVTKEDFEKYYEFRWRILSKPWNLPRGTEKDDKEETAIHIMACEENKVPAGVGRAHFNTEDEAQIRYMAIDENMQGKGIGSLILIELEKRAKEKGAKLIILNARNTAVKFYEKYCYKIVHHSHTLYNTTPHFLMKKYL